MHLVPALGRDEAGELPCVQGQLGLKSERSCLRKTKNERKKRKKEGGRKGEKVGEMGGRMGERRKEGKKTPKISRPAQGHLEWVAETKENRIETSKLCGPY